MVEEVKKGKPSVKSEYSMGMFDFERYNTLLQYADAYAFHVKSGNYKFMRNFHAILSTLFYNFKPIMYESKEVLAMEQHIKYLDTKIPRCERIISSSSNSQKFMNKYVLETLDILFTLHKNILEIKQKIGLGIATKTDMSKRKLMKIGLRGIDAKLPSSNE